MKIRTCIFDLDGVIVDTARLHFLAWRRLANELGFDFTTLQNEQLKGMRRRACLEMILNWGDLTMSEDEILLWMNRKNEWYLDMIKSLAEGEAFPGVVEFIRHLKNLGLHIALGSASQNAVIILDKLNITNLFDRIVDGNSVTNGKPHPETFLKAIEGTDIKSHEGIVFEDSIAGTESAIRGGFFAVGVGKVGALPAAHIVIPGFVDLDFSYLVTGLLKSQVNSDSNL